MSHDIPDFEPHTTNNFVKPVTDEDARNDDPRDDAPTSDSEPDEEKIPGRWRQLAGRVKARWSKLTDDDLKVAEGDRRYLTGRIQERYGVAEDEAKKQIEEFERTL